MYADILLKQPSCNALMDVWSGEYLTVWQRWLKKNTQHIPRAATFKMGLLAGLFVLAGTSLLQGLVESSHPALVLPALKKTVSNRAGCREMLSCTGFEMHPSWTKAGLYEHLDRGERVSIELCVSSSECFHDTSLDNDKQHIQWCRLVFYYHGIWCSSTWRHWALQLHISL